MANTRKVVFWGGEDVLGCSVEKFLSAREAWEVIRILNRLGEETLAAVVAREKPDVAVLYLGHGDDKPRLPLRLIQECPGLKVITVGLGSNTIEVYSRQEVKVGNLADFLTLVEAG